MLLVNLIKPESEVRKSLKPQNLLFVNRFSPLRVGETENFGRVYSLMTALRIIKNSILSEKNELEKLLKNMSAENTRVFEVQKNYEKSVGKLRSILQTTEYGTANPIGGHRSVKLNDANTGEKLAQVFGYFPKSLNGKKIQIIERATRSLLVGEKVLNREFFQTESGLNFREGTQKIRIKIQSGQTPEELVQMINAVLAKEGFHFSVWLSEDSRLKFEAGKVGSRYKFVAMSERTCAISTQPGIEKKEVSGKDLLVKIGEEIFEGDGEVLTGIGFHEFGETSLKVNGNLQLEREHQIFVEQKGLDWDDDAKGGTISLPHIEPENLGSGVKNKSRFGNLADLIITDEEKLYDACLIVKTALEEIEDLSAEITGKMNSYEKLLEKEKPSLNIARPMKDSEFFSYEKADEMSLHLRKILMKMKEISHI